MAASAPSAPAVAAAALLVREDGRVLLVRHRDDDGVFAGRWSLPMELVAPHEMVEEALERALRDRMHVEPGPYEFSETLYLVGEDGARMVVNAFACRGWAGEPRFGSRDYRDAAWIGASALAGEPGRAGDLGDAVPPELRAWLSRELGVPWTAGAGGSPAAAPRSRAELLAELAAARDVLFGAFDALPEGARAEPAEGSWTPVDLLARAGSAEAYLVAEARRLIEIPGHPWRPFNEGQWESEQRSREHPGQAEVRERLLRVRAETEAWLAGLGEAEFSAYGLHPERGAVTISSRVVKIASRDRDQAAALMRLRDGGEDAATAGAGAAAGTGDDPCCC